jgi:hypothetical protein
MTIKEKLQDLADQSETEVVFSHIGPIAKEAIEALTSKDLANSALFRTLRFRNDEVLVLRAKISLYEDALMGIAASHDLNPSDERILAAREVLTKTGAVKR